MYKMRENVADQESVELNQLYSRLNIECEQVNVTKRKRIEDLMKKKGTPLNISEINILEHDKMLESASSDESNY